MLSLGKFKPSLVISALKKSVSESRISQKYDGLGVSDFENLDLGVSDLSGARFRRNVNEARFCDASHITRHWTCAIPYDLIDATEHSLCTCKSFFNSRPFLFLSSNHVMMSLCTHSAARQWPRLKFSLSFRKQLRPYDLTISLRAEEFKPYEPRPFVVVSKLKATGLPLCFIT